MVANLINNNGRAVANQFVIVDGKDINFQSYNSLVCSIRNGGMGFEKVIVFGRDWDYSRTTTKHLVSFLRQNNIALNNTSDIRRALNKGYIIGHEEIAVWFDETMK